jgi:hypothetical protein
MGTELALYWSELSVYTSSVARAYFLPALRGVLGAGEGGRLWPSMSSTGPLLFEGSPAIVIVLRPVRDVWD